MDLSQIKMVVTDMDGTLLNSQHEVSHRFYELFYELQKRNIIFVAASGRQYNSMADKLAEIKDDIVIVSENGAYVKRREEVLLTTPLGYEDILPILGIVNNTPGAHAALCCKHNAYVSGESDAFLGMLRQYYSNFDVVDLMQPVDEEVLKVAIYHFESSEKYIFPAMQHLSDTLKVKVSGPNWVDVSSRDAHKGHAIEKLMKEYQIQPHELLVFGDYNNDLEMLSLADYSFAMENAHPNVLKVANYTTLSNDQNGVEHILEKMLGMQS
ncbi:HAD family hydrolase [Spongiimicrobium salis]|uniref:HAD family hydrolase n=1 Tax=Spongiimicrobium salis TaxID=1667022 RepID=UPI00374DBB2A